MGDLLARRAGAADHGRVPATTTPHSIGLASADASLGADRGWRARSSSSPKPTTTVPRWAGRIRIGFWAFERLIDPSELPQIKLQANDWEAEYTGLGRHPESRPLNLDPGYVTSAKLVLASTKDHAHRIYLSRGIFAEVTLYYKDRHWQHREFTFPNYRRA